MSFAIRDILELLAQGRNLASAQAEAAFDALMEGDLSEAQAGALLMGLRVKGETAEELAAGVRAALKQARMLPQGEGDSIDTCGTGGDNSQSFNCSTAVALFLAAMGHKVVKHGNRAVSSSCGSADAVEALGLPLPQTPDEAEQELARRSFVFLFAPAYHPAFARIAPVRRDMGIRTLFNLMGPLLNPARPTHQILGVGHERFLDLVAQALAMGGIRKALVVHGAGGFDELTPFGPAQARLVQDGKVTAMDIDPQALGLARRSPEEVRVSGKDEAVRVLHDVLAGKAPEAMLDMVALNLGAALWLLTGTPLDKAVAEAGGAVRAGLAGKVLHA